MLDTSYYWDSSSYDTLFVTVLFIGCLQGFLLYGFLGENTCVLCIYYILCILLNLLLFHTKILIKLIRSRKTNMVSEPL